MMAFFGNGLSVSCITKIAKTLQNKIIGLYRKCQMHFSLVANPAEPDKLLYAGIIYAKNVDNSATVTKQLLGKKIHGRGNINDF